MQRPPPEVKSLSTANQPFAKLQKILERQKVRPLRTSPPKNNAVNIVETGLVLNRKKVENQERTVKRMFPDKGIATGILHINKQVTLGRI